MFIIIDFWFTKFMLKFVLVLLVDTLEPRNARDENENVDDGDAKVVGSSMRAAE